MMATLCRYMPQVKTEVFYGGVPLKEHKDTLKNNTPHIVIGTPGRLLALVKSGDMKLDNVKHFILDECDRMVSGASRVAICAFCLIAGRCSSRSWTCARTCRRCSAPRRTTSKC